MDFASAHTLGDVRVMRDNDSFHSHKGKKERTSLLVAEPKPTALCGKKSAQILTEQIWLRAKLNLTSC